MIDKLVNRAWKVLEEKNVFTIPNEKPGAHPWLSVRGEHVQMPSGRVIESWFTLEFPNWVSIIAETEDGKMVMIDQYRHGIRDTRYEIVAGVIDPGEAPIEAAKRELLEETGFGGGIWSEFMVLSPNTSNHNNLSYTFLAKGVHRIKSQHQEDTEDIHVHLMEKEDVRELAMNGGILQALHAAPLLKYFIENPIKE